MTVKMQLNARIVGGDDQGHNKVRWRPGREARLAPPCSNLIFSERNLLYWRMYMWHCWEFSAPPAVICHPQQWFDSREIMPPCLPSLRPYRRHRVLVKPVNRMGVGAVASVKVTKISFVLRINF